MKYIFIHIGKTAGTSFRNFLVANVPKHYFGYGKLHFLTHESAEVFNVANFYRDEPMGDAIFEHFDLFSEHAPFGLHRFLPTKDYKYIAMLREPVARTISAYRYAIDRGWCGVNTSIIDWYNEPENRDKLHYQLNYVSGLPIEAPSFAKIDVALKNLKSEKFLFGFTEEYNEFIDLLCNQNDWKPMYQTTNVTRSKKPIPKNEKIELAIHLKDEIHFYNEAKKIYKEKYD